MLMNFHIVSPVWSVEADCKNTCIDIPSSTLHLDRSIELSTNLISLAYGIKITHYLFIFLLLFFCFFVLFFFFLSDTFHVMRKKFSLSFWSQFELGLLELHFVSQQSISVCRFSLFSAMRCILYLTCILGSHPAPDFTFLVEEPGSVYGFGFANHNLISEVALKTVWVATFGNQWEYYGLSLTMLTPPSSYPAMSILRSSYPAMSILQ